MRALGIIRDTFPVKKFGSYIKVKEMLTTLSQVRMFSSGALKQQFFPTAAIFVFLCIQTLVLWDLGVPLEQRYLIFPTKSPIYKELSAGLVSHIPKGSRYSSVMKLEKKKEGGGMVTA